jgi:hypothetical protein
VDSCSGPRKNPGLVGAGRITCIVVVIHRLMEFKGAIG